MMNKLIDTTIHNEFHRLQSTKYIDLDECNRKIKQSKDEVPEWLVKQLNESIINCILLEEESKDNGDIDGAISANRKARTLRWVLNLKDEPNEVS